MPSDIAERLPAPKPPRAQPSVPIAKPKEQVVPDVTQQTGGPQPILVVRTGPAPPNNPPDMQSLIRDAMRERSSLRRVGDLIAIDEPRASERLEPTSATDGSAPAQSELRIPGSAAPKVSEPGRLVSTGKLKAAESTAPDLELMGSGERRQVETADAAAEPREQARVGAATASQTGGVQNPEEPRRVDLPGSGSGQAAGRALSERTFTQVGAVEAASHDALITRFFSGSRPEDAGPEPDPNEKLGERNVPLSRYA